MTLTPGEEAYLLAEPAEFDRPQFEKFLDLEVEKTLARRANDNGRPVVLFDGYSPHPKAWRAFTDDSRFLLMLAGRRGAKTHTGARRMLRMIYEHDLPRWLPLPYLPGAARRGTAMWWKRRPRLHYWVVADSYDLLKEPVRYLLEFLPPELLEHADAGSNALWLRPDILIEFVTIHDPKAKVGSGLNGAWIEEAARASPEAWPGFLRPALSDKAGWAQFTTTPLGRAWTYAAIEQPALRGMPGYAVHTWVSADNIRSPNLLVDVEEARRMLPGPYFKREYEASREAFIGQIYPFDERTMVVDGRLQVINGERVIVPPAGVQLVRRLGGQDWGFTAPGAHLSAGLTSLDPNQAHLWIVDEVYDSSQLVEAFWVPQTLAKMKRWRYSDVVADPAEPDNLMRYRAAGINCVGHKNYSKAPFDEHDRSVRAGIRVLAALMHQGRFHVLRHCVNLIEELKSYRWDSHKTGPLGGTLIERPAPGQKDHAATACRYIASWGLRGAAFSPLERAAA